MKYTPEDIFRIVKERAKTQEKAIEKIANPHSPDFPQEEKCRYRAPNGLKCFVGELIPDEVFKPEMEDKAVWSLLGDVPAFINLFCCKHAYSEYDFILVGLQKIHDFEHPKTWMDKIMQLEKDYYNIKLWP
jgi:hypothetical protein